MNNFTSWAKFDKENKTVNGKSKDTGSKYFDLSNLPYTQFEEVSATDIPEVEEEVKVETKPRLTSVAQANYFKFLCNKYCISVKVPVTSKESSIKITAILKGVKSGRVKLRPISYTGRDAECLVGAMDQR